MSHYKDQYEKDQEIYHDYSTIQKLHYSNTVHGISILVSMLEHEMSKQTWDKNNVDKLLEDVVRLAQNKQKGR